MEFKEVGVTEFWIGQGGLLLWYGKLGLVQQEYVSW